MKQLLIILLVLITTISCDETPSHYKSPKEKFSHNLYEEIIDGKIMFVTINDVDNVVYIYDPTDSLVYKTVMVSESHLTSIHTHGDVVLMIVSSFILGVFITLFKIG